MSGKLLRFSAALVCVLLISGPVSADVAGTWDISATVKEKITIKGEGSASERMEVADQFVFGVFGQNKTFDMAELPDGPHRWEYVNKKMTKFAVYLDNEVLETYWTDTLEEMFWDYGIDADVQNLIVTKNVFAGNENTKKGTIKGKWTLMFGTYLYVHDVNRGFDMKVKVTTNFTGVRSTGTSALTLESTQSSEFSEEAHEHTLLEEVCNQIRKTIMGGEPE